MPRFKQTPLPRPYAADDPIVEQVMLEVAKRSFYRLSRQQYMWHIIADDCVARCNQLLAEGKLSA